MARRLEHILLVSSRWFLDRHMYKKNEITKARLALLKHTNMLSYAAEEYKRINDEEAPSGLRGCLVLG